MQAPFFTWNASAPAFEPASASKPGGETQPSELPGTEGSVDNEDVPEFSKAQVQKIIEMTTAQVSESIAEMYESKLQSLEARVKSMAVIPPSTQKLEDLVEMTSRQSASKEDKERSEDKLLKLHDFVELHGLKSGDLNGEKGVVVKMPVDGRVGVRLGEHRAGKVVSIKAANLRLIVSGAEVEAVQKLRDDGRSVRSLIQQGYSTTACQRDSSSKLCKDCCRPRYMCSCTFGYEPSLGKSKST